MKDFFAPSDNLPVTDWSMYDYHHILFLVAIFIVMLLFIRGYKKADEKGKRKIMLFLAGILFVQEITKDIIHLIIGDFEIEHLPLHLCGISIIVSIIHTFYPTKFSKQYLYCLSMPGALCALLFPDWTKYPMLHFSNINSFTIHGWLVIYTMVLLCNGEIKPNFKYLKYPLIFIIVYSLPIYFLNKALDTNFMFLNIPSPGSPLVLISDLVTMKFYIPTLLVLLLVVWFIMYLPWHLFKK